MSELGRVILGVGLLLVLIGAVLMFAGRLGVPLGRLPGDVVYRGKHMTVFFPIVTCIVISIVASVLMYLFSRFR
ncbi:MAG TPA: DUF2905 domain-containing protein [Terracidiphilus sp.]|nr:DUF2905 domain-containing protein [Terracidiphilus sp.]